MSPLIAYERANLSLGTREVIDAVNTVIEEYRAAGYDLTLRQVYYQMIARDLLPESWIDKAYNLKNGLHANTKNTVKNYKRLGDMVSKGRRNGLIDWNAIVDRTRNLLTRSAWASPHSIVHACSTQFRFDLWEDQETYVEVWYEKDALMGVFERATQRFRVPYFSCRGYASDSEVWAAAMRLRRQHKHHGKDVVILHFGDHDPSGIDMTRDIRDRLHLFGDGFPFEVRRLALNMDQVEEYDPPPNPAKESDSRFIGYRDEYGDESWELDALDPPTLAALVNDEIEALISTEAWDEGLARERRAKSELAGVAERWDFAVKAVEKKYGLRELEDGDEEDE